MASDRGLFVYAGLAVLTLFGAAGWFFLGASHEERSAIAVPRATPVATVTPTMPPPPPTIPVAAPVAPPPKVYWPAIAGFEPTRFDAEAFLPTALADARKVWKDATLVWLSAVDVAADGTSDLSAPFERAVSYAFRSPTADAGTACLHWVYVDKLGAWSETGAASSKLCAIPAAAIAPRRCTVARAFARAAEKDHPRPGRARVFRWSLDRLDNGKIRADWSFSGFPTTHNDAATDLSSGFPDDCAKEP